MARPSDRNLLFGIIALQMDFVTEAALLDGVHAWSLDKEKDLGDVLCEQNSLTPEYFNLLNPLVDAHISQHGGDPRESLAALSSDAEIVTSLEQIVDDDLQASLSLLTKPDAAPPLDVGAQSTALPPQQDAS